MARFDTIYVVDWSAAGKPCTGANSIWIGIWRGGAPATVNPATRAEAMALLRAEMAADARAGRRVLAGFDFALGYPSGLTRALGVADWRGVWAILAEGLSDGADNANTRFHFAGALNALYFRGQGPFWGNGLRAEVPGLPRRKPSGWGTLLPDNLRACDARARGAQEVWKLSGAGSVGGQTLTGIARLEPLRHATGATVWPFEPPGPGPVLAEVYPSFWPLDLQDGGLRDQAQVRQTAVRLAGLDRAGDLAELVSERRRMSPEVVNHAGWMLGVPVMHES